MEIISTLLHTLASVGVALGIFVSNIASPYLESRPVISIAPDVAPTATSPATTTASTTPAAQKAFPQSTAALAQPGTPSNTPASTSPAKPQMPADELNARARAALVNILCLTHGTDVHAISGSGVFIDARGIVLTNAHVGQFFLLKDYPSPDSVDCVLRTGSPAQSVYKAKLLYLPPAWVAANASKVNDKEARGTGEYDYAFLLVTDTADSKTPPPQKFPALPMTLQEPDLDENTLLAGYPAGFLDGAAIQKNLYATSAFALVKSLYTFGTGRDIDLVSIGGTVVSQGGSSGGAMMRAEDGRLQGIIATASAADTTAERDLRALTLAYINRSLVQLGKGGLVDLLSQDPTKEVENFESKIAPDERSALVHALEQN